MIRKILPCILSLFIPCSLLAEGGGLKVGVVAPLSGSVAAMGEAFRKGFALYEQDTAERDKKVQFIFEDDKYDGKSAVSAMHKLHDVDQVDLVVVWGNTPSGSCAPVAEKRRIPLLAVSFNPDAKGREYVVTFGPKTELLVAKVVEEFQRWKVSRPAAVSIDIGNALLGVQMLKEQLHGNLLVRTVANDESDFKTLLAGLRANKADAVFLLTMPEQALTFIRQASDLKYPLKVVGGDIFAEDAFRAAAAEKLGALAFVYGAVDEAFIRRLKDVFKSSSYFFETASGYSIAALLHRLALLPALRREKLIDELNRVDLNGVPVGGLKLLRDDEYGLHFEVAAAAYQAQ